MNKSLMLVVAMVLLLLSVLGAFAANTTMTVFTNVSIVCNNASQCVTVVDGSPVFFSGSDANTTLSVRSVFSYEPNITMNTSNVTYVTQNVTVVTTNVTIVQCNQSTVPPVFNVSSGELFAGIQDQVSASCRSACSLSDTERQEFLSQVQNAQLSAREVNLTYNVMSNMSRMQYDNLNATMTQQVDDLKGQFWSIAFVAFLAVSIACVILFVVMHKTRVTKGTSGRDGRFDGGAK